MAMTRAERLAELDEIIDGAITELAGIQERRRIAYSAGDQSVDWDRHAEELRTRIKDAQELKRILGGLVSIQTRMKG